LGHPWKKERGTILLFTRSLVILVVVFFNCSNRRRITYYVAFINSYIERCFTEFLGNSLEFGKSAERP
jgi:hypothetical protein